MDNAGVLGIVTGVGKGIVIDYRKRKFTTVIVFSNASIIVNISKNVHSSVAFYFECRGLNKCNFPTFSQ